MNTFHRALAGTVLALAASLPHAASASIAPASSPVLADAGSATGDTSFVRPDRTQYGSGNATTAHRTWRLGQPIAGRSGVDPSGSKAEQDASTAPATGRNAHRPPAPRIGISPSAPDTLHD